MGSTEKQVVLAVIGLGYWGPNIARVLHELPDVQVRYLCDRDPARLEPLLRRYPAARAAADVDEVLSDPEVDAVCIATPVFTHYDLTKRALLAGKHTLVEKPLALSRAEAQGLVDLADERDLTLLCGHTFLYSPPVRAVKRLLDGGELGDLYFVSSSRVNLGLHQQDVSVIWDLGPHDFSILLHWLGEMPTTVRATGRDSIIRGLTDVAFVTLQYESGLIVNVELSWLAPSKLRRTALVGSEKMVVYDDSSGEPVRIFDHGVLYRDPETFGEYHLSYRTGDIVSPKVEATEPLSIELADFVDSVRSGDRRLDFLGIAANVVCIAEAAETSLRSGGAPVPVEPAAVPSRPAS